MSDWENPVSQEYRSRAEAWIPSVYARAPEVTSADKAFAWLREHGLYVPRAYVREAWGAEIRGSSYMEIASRLSPEDVIPTSWMTQTSFEYGARYNYIVKRPVPGSETDPTLGDWVTVTSDVLLTQGETLAAAAQIYHDYGVETDLPEFDLTFEQVKYRR